MYMMHVRICTQLCGELAEILDVTLCNIVHRKQTDAGNISYSETNNFGF